MSSNEISDEEYAKRKRIGEDYCGLLLVPLLPWYFEEARRLPTAEFEWTVPEATAPRFALKQGDTFYGLPVVVDASLSVPTVRVTAASGDGGT